MFVFDYMFDNDNNIKLKLIDRALQRLAGPADRFGYKFGTAPSTVQLKVY